jgi:hypothetical protein
LCPSSSAVMASENFKAGDESGSGHMGSLIKPTMHAADRAQNMRCINAALDVCATYSSGRAAMLVASRQGCGLDREKTASSALSSLGSDHECLSLVTDVLVSSCLKLIRRPLLAALI